MSAKQFEKSPETDMRMKISGLIEQVRCGDERDCAEDVHNQLVAIGAPAVPALLEAIRVEKGAPRLALVRVLRQLDDPLSTQVLIGLLSDDDFDVRWEAIEGLSSQGYDGLQPLIAAIIENPGSARLRGGAHHILHHIAGEGYYNLLKPLMMAIEGAIPNVEVPAAARAVQAEMVRTGLKSK